MYQKYLPFLELGILFYRTEFISLFLPFLKAKLVNKAGKLPVVVLPKPLQEPYLAVFTESFIPQVQRRLERDDMTSILQKIIIPIDRPGTDKIMVNFHRNYHPKSAHTDPKLVYGGQNILQVGMFDQDDSLMPVQLHEIFRLKFEPIKFDKKQ